LLPIVVDAQTHRLLFDLAEEMPRAELTVDLASQTVTLPIGHTVNFPIDGFSKACLLRATDELGYLLSFENQIAAYEAVNG
jgi:3-isopropylmalate/(R)-2-methylmalate dehydratase small subunit